MKKSKTQEMVFTALMTALLALISPHIIPIGAIPFTLSVFGIALTAAMLPPVSAVVSVAVYMALGCIGLPVFSGYRGGPQVLLGPTGGYLVGYFLLAISISVSVWKVKEKPAKVGVITLGFLGFYALGTIWFMYVAGTTFITAFMACVLPFIIPDIIKIVLAMVLANEVSKRLKWREKAA